MVYYNPNNPNALPGQDPFGFGQANPVSPGAPPYQSEAYAGPKEPPPPLADSYPEPDISERGPLAAEALREPTVYMLGPMQLGMVVAVEGDEDNGPQLTPRQAAFLVRQGVTVTKKLSRAARDMSQAHDVALDVLSVRAAHEIAAHTERRYLQQSLGRLSTHLMHARQRQQPISPEAVRAQRMQDAWEAREAAQVAAGKFRDYSAEERAEAIGPVEEQQRVEFETEFIEANRNWLLQERIVSPDDLKHGAVGLRRALRRAYTLRNLAALDPRKSARRDETRTTTIQRLIEQRTEVAENYSQGLEDIVYGPLVHRMVRHANGLLVPGVYPAAPAAPGPTEGPTVELPIVMNETPVQSPQQAGTVAPVAEEAGGPRQPESATKLAWQFYVLNRIGRNADAATLADTLIGENPDLMGGDETKLRAYINDTLEQLAAKGYADITHNDGRGNVTIAVTDEGSAQAAAFAGRVELMDAIEYAASRFIFTRQNLMDDLGLDEAQANNRLARLIDQGVIEEYEAGYYLLKAGVQPKY